MFIEKKNENYFSIVIPTMWESEFIHEMLEEYEKCDLVKEVIIIDNNYQKKPDLSKFKKIIYYTENKNIYVNPAWNIGYTISSYKLILANDDIVIKNINEVLSLINSNQNFDIIGVSWEDSKKLELKKIESWGVTGFGCFMYIKNYISIPREYKIWRGDFLLFSQSKLKGIISNPLLFGSLSKTVESTNELKEIAKNDVKTYNKKYNKDAKKILFVLVNYGTEQINFLKQVTKEIKNFKNYICKVIVHSNVQIDDNNTDEVIIFNNLNDYQLLPLTCRKTIKKNIDKYDLYVYGENDHLFLEHHFDKFLEYSEILPDNRISGLIQYENDDNNNIYYPAFFKKFDWDYTTVEEYEGKKFAHFSNIHQASFIITNHQLNKICEKYDFETFFGDSPEYSVKCKVNTDIYKFCDMKKLICITDFKNNLIHHLPNLYINGEKGRNKNQRSEHLRMINSILKLLSKKSTISLNNELQNLIMSSEHVVVNEPQKNKLIEEKVQQPVPQPTPPPHEPVKITKTLEKTQKQINYERVNQIFNNNKIGQQTVVRQPQHNIEPNKKLNSGASKMFTKKKFR